MIDLVGSLTEVQQDKIGCLPCKRDLVRSSTSSVNCVSQDLRSRKPYCRSYKMCFSKCLIKLEAMTCSMDLHMMHVREMGR